MTFVAIETLDFEALLGVVRAAECEVAHAELSLRKAQKNLLAARAEAERWSSSDG